MKRKNNRALYSPILSKRPSFSDTRSEDSEDIDNDFQKYEYNIDSKRNIGPYVLKNKLVTGGFGTCFVASRSKNNFKNRIRKQKRKRAQKCKSTNATNATDGTDAKEDSKYAEPVTESKVTSISEKRENTLFCIKIYHNRPDTAWYQHAEALKEKQVSEKVNVIDEMNVETNILKIYDVSQFTALRQTWTYLTCPLYDEDLHSFVESSIDECGGLSLDIILHISKSIANGIKSLGKHGFVHTDLKLENILIKQTDEGLSEKDCNLSVCICDFGSVHVIGEALQNNGRTLQYSAPELICEISPQITTATDIFAFGCILYRLLTNSDLFDYEEETYILALQRYLSDSDFTAEVYGTVEYFNRFKIIHNDGDIAMQSLKPWYEVHSKNIPIILTRIIQMCTQCRPDMRYNINELIKSLESAAKELLD